MFKNGIIAKISRFNVLQAFLKATLTQILNEV